MVTIGHQRRDRVQQAVDVGDASRVTDLLLQRQQPVRGRGWSLICQDHTDPIFTHLLRRSSSIRVVIVALFCVWTQVVPTSSPLPLSARFYYFNTTAEPALDDSGHRRCAGTTFMHATHHTQQRTSPGARPRRRTFYPTAAAAAQTHTVHSLLLPRCGAGGGGHSVPRAAAIPFPPHRTRRAASADRWRERERATSLPLCLSSFYAAAGSRHSNNKRIHHPFSGGPFRDVRDSGGHRPT